eukprot:SM000129S26136  [mRNA]  locus=s129:104058:113037:- [translate_table: standard]
MPPPTGDALPPRSSPSPSRRHGRAPLRAPRRWQAAASAPAATPAQLPPTLARQVGTAPDFTVLVPTDSNSAQCPPGPTVGLRLLPIEPQRQDLPLVSQLLVRQAAANLPVVVRSLLVTSLSWLHDITEKHIPCTEHFGFMQFKIVLLPLTWLSNFHKHAFTLHRGTAVHKVLALKASNNVLGNIAPRRPALVDATTLIQNTFQHQLHCKQPRKYNRECNAISDDYRARIHNRHASRAKEDGYQAVSKQNLHVRQLPSLQSMKQAIHATRADVHPTLRPPHSWQADSVTRENCYREDEAIATGQRVR